MTSRAEEVQDDTGMREDYQLTQSVGTCFEKKDGATERSCWVAMLKINYGGGDNLSEKLDQQLRRL